MAVKKQKIKSLNQYLECIPDIQKIRVSSDIFYGVFLGLSLLLTGLFLGVSQQVQAMEQPVKTISPEQFRLERDVEKMVEGYPIEKMIPYMGTRDRETVAYLVGIAKKESNWGKRVPRTEEGEDCYNYWGYRGEGSRGMAMGHGCFGSKKEAVAVVSKRLDTLIHEYKRDTAEDLVVWKCGYSCDGHSKESVQGWIDDVDYYATKVKD
ncbi:MAG: hypothetical protein KIH67_000105 [Candidatus Moranbacteria bacterium]|nr:hypothetical protein [Candidatus Moranbacteria bacterium]